MRSSMPYGDRILAVWRSNSQGLVDRKRNLAGQGSASAIRDSSSSPRTRFASLPTKKSRSNMHHMLFVNRCYLFSRAVYTRQSNFSSLPRDEPPTNDA